MWSVENWGAAYCPTMHRTALITKKYLVPEGSHLRAGKPAPVLSHSGGRFPAPLFTDAVPTP